MKKKRNNLFGDVDREVTDSLSSRARRAFMFGSDLSANDESEEQENTVDNEGQTGEEGEKIRVTILEDESLDTLEDVSISASAGSDAAAVEMSEAELEELEERIASYQSEAQENYDKYVRAVAELENVKKRNAKERSDLIRYAGEGLARDVVDIVDDLERAATQDASVPSTELLQGIELILKRFRDVLERHSIVGDDAANQTFDPNKHEALATIPSADHPAGIVMEQFKKAYFFKDKLLRPAQVVVSAEPLSSATQAAAEDEE